MNPTNAIKNVCFKIKLNKTKIIYGKTMKRDL